MMMQHDDFSTLRNCTLRILTPFISAAVCMIFFRASCHSLVEIHRVASFWSQHISEHCSLPNIIVFTLSSAPSSLKCRAPCKSNGRPCIASNNTYSSLPRIKTRWNERPCTYTPPAYGLHQYWNDYKKLLHRKRGRMPAQRLLRFSAARLFSGSESRGLMALGINGEVISRAYALGPARGGRGLCAAACTPTWVFVHVHVSVQDASVCALCSLRPPTTGVPDWQPRTRGEANTRANKHTLVQLELHVLTQLCQQPRYRRRLPLGSATIKEQSNWKGTYIYWYFIDFFFLLQTFH